TTRAPWELRRRSVRDAHLRAHREFLSGRRAKVPQHSSRGQEESAIEGQAAIERVGHAGTHASALRVQQELYVRMRVEYFIHVFRPNGAVHVAEAGVSDDVASLRLS